MPGRKFIQDQFTPVKKVGDNRYQLRDGRVVSRQRIEQMRHPDRASQRRVRAYHKRTGSERYHNTKYATPNPA